MTLEEIRRLKEEKGYTIAKLADYSGVPLGTLQKILNGETQKPRKATLNAIERVLLSKEMEYTGKSFYYANRSIQSGFVSEPGSGYDVNGTGALRGTYDMEKLTNELKSQGFAKSEYGVFTEKDYRDLPQELRVELIEGVFFDMSAPSSLHQEILVTISSELYYQIKKKKGECKVFTAPTDIRIKSDDKNMVQPDIFIVCDRKKITYDSIEGCPDFVLEIISPSTKKKDMLTKLQLYLEAGVREYWIVEPMEQKLLIYSLETDCMIPRILPFTGEMGLAIYGEEIKVNLDEIAQIVREYEEKR